MLKIQRILCPTDFSEFSERAFDYALSLAQHYGAEVLLQHVVRPLNIGYPEYALPDAVSEFYGELCEHAEDQLREFAKAHAPDGHPTRAIVEEGGVTERILAVAKEQSVDLIVMGTHGRKGFERLALGSVTEKVLRKAHCPVMAVRKPEHSAAARAKGTEPIRLDRILFCSDFSACSSRAFEYALSITAQYHAELSLLHVMEREPSEANLQAETEKLRKRLEEPVTEEARKLCKIQSVVRAGIPHQEIVRLAQDTQAALVVVGVHGHHALDLALFGSTTYRVIQLGPCPVFAVHD